MGQFRIQLPNNQYADVRWGTVKRKQLDILQLLRLKKNVIEKNIGYIVKVRPVLNDIPEYHLMKSKHGEWLRKSDCDWVREGDGTMTTVIRKAIDEFESKEQRI